MLRLQRRTEAHSPLRSALLVIGLLLVLPMSPAGATTEEGPIVTTLNGVELGADGSHRVEGCMLDIGVSGLPTEPVTVRVRIDTIAPTTAEGTTVALVDDGHETAVEFEQVYDMTDRLVAFEPKTNGYRLSVAVDVAGESQGTKDVWLACGAAQDGRPSRIAFDVRWLGQTGQAIAEPLDGLMPAGWRTHFEIRATSLRGTAICTMPAGDDELVCRYDNPGHGSDDGLVVPGGKRHTYDVAQNGLPPGWEVDGTTVGTFLGRETCPASGCGGHDDGGHDDGGHDDDGSCSDAVAATTASPTADAGPCRHVVVNRLVAAPIVPPLDLPADPVDLVDPVDERAPVPPPPATAQVLASTGTAPPTVAARPLATLPATGPGAAWLATPAALSVAAGLWLTIATRTRVGTNQRDDR